MSGSRDEKITRMNICEIVFSPTGATRRAADVVSGRLAERLGCGSRTLDLMRREGSWRGASCSGDEVAVIAVPSFGGRVPSVAAERLAAVDGGGARAVLVCAYGNRAFEDTIAELEDVATAAGFRVVAAVAAVTEHSIVRRYGAGRPDGEDVRRLGGYADRIAERLAAGAAGPLSPLPGNRTYRESKRVGLVPEPTRSCTGCGACAARCPVGAIAADDVRKVDAGKCISCMACVAVCPEGARRISRLKMAAVTAMLRKVCSERRESELFL